MDSCLHCEGTKLFSFTAADGRITGPLPVGCRTCGAMYLDGVELKPDESNHSREAALAAQQLEESPEDPIGAYFNRVYSAGYRDGLVKSWAYFHHTRREGRLFRIRELWNTSAEKTSSGRSAIVTMGGDTYDEISQLLCYGDKNARPSNPNRSI